MRRDAAFSECGKYRWWLRRDWSHQMFGEPDDPVVFVGLNPSIADAEIDDPTIRRCIGFAKNWGSTALIMVNLFPLIETDSKKLTACAAGAMDQNRREIYQQTKDAGMTVVAWGAHDMARREGPNVIHHWIYGRPMCLGLTKDGWPKHPLYLRRDTEPVPYRLPITVDVVAQDSEPAEGDS